jgi:hypothetical protein
MGRTYISTAEIYLVNPASVNPTEGNFSNPSQIGTPLYASSISIPFEMKTDEVEFLGTNGSYVQVMGVEAIEMEMTINNWSLDFIDSIIGRDENDRVYSKPVTFLVRGRINEQGSAKFDEVQFITFGQFMSGDILNLEAGNAQSTDYTFSVEQLSIKSKGRSNTYNLVG